MAADFVEQASERGDIETVSGILKQRFGERFSTSKAVREQHGHTTSWIQNQPPQCVVFVENSEEVSDVVKVCAEHDIPIIPFGTGTSLEGHVNAPQGGVSIDLSRMNRVLTVNTEDLDCVVEPGVTRKQLNEFLRDTGLFFPIDPGADASLGGMAATRASGTNAVRYGTMRDNIINLTAVLPDGRILKTGNRARKSSAGYDLARLLIGSEGTLGIITELTLKLQGIPQAISGGVCPFPTVEDACNAVIMTIQYGIPVARIELLDALQVKACNAYSNLDLPEQPTLFLEFHGTDASVAEQAELFGDIASDCDGGEFVWTANAEERTKLWQARHDVYWASLGLRPGCAGISTDVCVPISRLAECVTETAKDIEELGFVAPIVGHVGDGNFHILVLLDMEDTQEVERARYFVSKLNKRAIDMDGTCTGEHGIGQGKMPYLEAEIGIGVDLIRQIKAVIDPQNIMNPGKIVVQSGLNEIDGR
ncbi:MAG: FAD-linked oxidase C-terminal domain-containing protein [Hyphomicrobiales bacterium]